MTLRQQLCATIVNSEKKIEGLLGEVAKVRGIINDAQSVLNSQNTLDFEISPAPEVAQVQSRVFIKPNRDRLAGEPTYTEIIRRALDSVGSLGMSRKHLSECIGGKQCLDGILSNLRTTGEIVRVRKAHYVSKKHMG